MSTLHRKNAAEVFTIEARSIADLSALLDKDFDAAVNLILKSKGRIVISGVGKSGLIGRKISATLASTGTPSLFLHPVEAFHGDLGVLKKEDVLIAISYSGETEEILKLIPFIRQRGVKVIGISGNPESTLGKNVNHHLNVRVKKEACPLELAPTSSTTATLAMGDALAVALMKARKFKSEDFAQYHPGGSLGRKLLTTVGQVMFKKELPIIQKTDQLPQIIDAMTKGRLGLAVVCSKGQQIEGIITDGDLRRAMEKHGAGLFEKSAGQIMTQKPRSVSPDLLLVDAEALMADNKITSLLVAEKNKLKGIIQLYSITNG